jgi:hypothetical protein
MEDFKSNTKMQCYKEGGQVKYETRKQHKEEMKSDVSQDKTMVKKGVSQHEANLHKGQPKTELKLKHGGRAKKSNGTVKKFAKASGEYGAKKTDADIKRIEGAKKFKVKKMQMGGMTGPAAAGPMAAAPSAATGQGQMTELEKRRMMEKMKRAMALDPAQQSDLIKQSPAAAGLVPPPAGRYKKGGSIKKCAEGGSLKETDAEENPGLAKLPTNVRNKMGYAKKGGKVC